MAKGNNTLIYVGIGAVVLSGLGFAAWKSGMFDKKTEVDNFAEVVQAPTKQDLFISEMNKILAETWIKNKTTQKEKIDTSVYKLLNTAKNGQIDFNKIIAFGLPSTWKTNSWLEAYSYANSLSDKYTY